MHTKYAAHCGKQLVKSIIIVHHKCIRKTLINHRQKSCERNNLLHHRTDLVPWRPLCILQNEIITLLPNSIIPVKSAILEVIWRVPCKIYPNFYRVPPEIFRLASTQIFFRVLTYFYLIYKYDTQLFSSCNTEKIWVDFTG